MTGKLHCRHFSRIFCTQQSQHDPELQIVSRLKFRQQLIMRRRPHTLLVFNNNVQFFLAVNFNFAKCEVLTMGVKRQGCFIERKHETFYINNKHKKLCFKGPHLLPSFTRYKMLKIANKVEINFALLTQPTQSKSIKAIKLQFDHSILIKIPLRRFHIAIETSC